MSGTPTSPSRGAAIAAVAAALLMTGCAASGPYVMELMPAPAVFEPGVIDPFLDDPAFADAPYLGMLYATDRMPAGPGDDELDRFYTSEHGPVLRLGTARIRLREDELDWEEVKQVSLAPERAEGYPLQVASVEELGTLDRSYHALAGAEPGFTPSAEPGKRFADLVNRKLALSRQKDVFIYVAGYKVIFDNPVLVATELWHYLGYEGAFIAFAWPSTPSRWAYFSDAETAILSSYHFRVLLEYLAEETDVERIHVIAYSQGTRLVAAALHALALKYSQQEPAHLAQRLRLGQVVLIGSDIERARIALLAADGVLRLPERLALYVSERDAALGLSRFLLGRERLGEMLDVDKLGPDALRFLEDNPQLQVINVSEAESAFIENGHRYFRKSPWVSSDLLMSLRYGLEPAERGLTTTGEVPVWTFPADYLDRLRRAVVQAQTRPRPASGER